MDDARLAEHIAKWIETLSLPSTVELRCRDEIVDSIEVEAGAPFAQYGADLIESAGNDALEEGKTRSYVLVGINEAQERYICPLRIRRRVDRSAGELVATLSKQNTELHQALMKSRNEAFALALRFAETVGEQNQKLVLETERGRGQQAEFYDKLEQVRSKQLERDLTVEKHKADVEIKERLTDAVVPLVLAIGSKFSGGMLPARNLQETMLIETVKALDEKQLDTIQSILGEDWPAFSNILTAALENNQGKVAEFREHVASLPQEKVMGLFQVLNMGQQAAVKELMNGRGN